MISDTYQDRKLYKLKNKWTNFAIVIANYCSFIFIVSMRYVVMCQILLTEINWHKVSATRCFNKSRTEHFHECAYVLSPDHLL